MKRLICRMFGHDDMPTRVGTSLAWRCERCHRIERTTTLIQTTTEEVAA